MYALLIVEVSRSNNNSKNANILKCHGMTCAIPLQRYTNFISHITLFLFSAYRNEINYSYHQSTRARVEAFLTCLRIVSMIFAIEAILWV